MKMEKIGPGGIVQKFYYVDLPYHDIPSWIWLKSIILGNQSHLTPQLMLNFFLKQFEVPRSYS